MIDLAEIRARAADLGLDASYMENDYVLCHLLVAVRWSDRELLLDMNMDVTGAMGGSEGRLDLPYKDLQGTATSIPVFSLTEILGKQVVHVE